MKDRTCVNCDGPIRARTPVARYCSASKCVKARREANPQYQTGAAERKRERYANDSMYAEHIREGRRRRQRERLKNDPEYAERRRAHNREYLKSKRDQNTREFREERRSAHQRRRARKRGVEVESYDRLVIAERDAWTCWLCGDPIDREALYPDPSSLSIDHLVPLVHHGADSPGNVGAAHLRCNLVRGDRIEVTTTASPATDAGTQNEE